MSEIGNPHDPTAVAIQKEIVGDIITYGGSGNFVIWDLLVIFSGSIVRVSFKVVIDISFMDARGLGKFGGLNLANLNHFAKFTKVYPHQSFALQVHDM